MGRFYQGMRLFAWVFPVLLVHPQQLVEEFVQFAQYFLEVFALKSPLFGEEFLHPAEVCPQLDEGFLVQAGKFPALDRNFHPLGEELEFAVQAGGFLPLARGL